ncbi:MAG: hypothetical protein M3Y50_04655 [Acidobacteriota bacterium]|nr:hypothetical protein [Acidobacteriota bacterium]
MSTLILAPSGRIAQIDSSGATMRFSRVWFSIAGWWGMVSLTPLFFLYNLVGSKNPPPITHPEYYFGFLCVALAWQIAFLLIARDPAKYRIMMLPAMVEKFGYAISCFILAAKHMAAGTTAVFGKLDLVLGIGFFVAWRATRSSSSAR